MIQILLFFLPSNCSLIWAHLIWEIHSQKKSVNGRKHKRNFGPITGLKRANNSGDFEHRFKFGYHLEINYIGNKFKR